VVGWGGWVFKNCIDFSLNAVELRYRTNKISSSQVFWPSLYYPLANTEEADETKTNEEVPEEELAEENEDDAAESAESPPEDDPTDPPVKDGAE
jgi:hypothetical protein